MTWSLHLQILNYLLHLLHCEFAISPIHLLSNIIIIFQNDSSRMGMLLAYHITIAPYQSSSDSISFSSKMISVDELVGNAFNFVDHFLFLNMHSVKFYRRLEFDQCSIIQSF